MALERRNPLPAGRYWQDFFGAQRAAFANWREQAKPHVKVEQVVPHEATDQSQAREWVLFSTDAPLPWDAVQLGFPTIAGQNIKSEGDTVQRPDPSTPGSVLKDIVGSEGARTFAGSVLGLVIAGVITHVVVSRIMK